MKGPARLCLWAVKGTRDTRTERAAGITDERGAHVVPGTGETVVRRIGRGFLRDGSVDDSSFFLALLAVLVIACVTA